MNYQELLTNHRENFTKGGNAEFHELCIRIGALAYSLTGKRIEDCKTSYALACVSNETALEAAALLGFEYDRNNLTGETYDAANEFLGNFLLQKTAK